MLITLFGVKRLRNMGWQYTYIVVQTFFRTAAKQKSTAHEQWPSNLLRNSGRL